MPPPKPLWLQWLEIKDTDDEKTKARKRKLQKSHKSKLRFQQLDQEVKSRQDNWQNFKKGKGARKKVRWSLVELVCSLCRPAYAAAGTSDIRLPWLYQFCSKSSPGRHRKFPCPHPGPQGMGSPPPLSCCWTPLLSCLVASRIQAFCSTTYSCYGALQTGFLSAGKKSSMFSVPEGFESKVGVIGSGQGMTHQSGVARHEFNIGL